jgi:spermidine/putrescine transport system permease protein
VAVATRVSKGPALRSRWGRALAPYLLILPGGGWMLLFFLLPIVTLAITSLESGDFLGGFNFTWQFENYSRGFSLYSTQFLHAVEYGGAATIVALVVSYPAAYWIAFHAGSRKSAYVLAVLLPFFASTFVFSPHR